ncbi:fluoride efflux transporter FluC [Geochorda subterranea]|uniref:Fluoride-specific ion channel FluC n=1 Tax=Geochorda subterranea TaxID=3109564 RepID=A0ABZ1BM93_9FIRM|nr:CrcB family protein [Limnochorda sp. LNt]WRP13932.1 CrcB family protein [Limnochorda sp. LNt]
MERRMLVTRLALVALGGAAGALARYLVGGWVSERLGIGFPWGTAVINVSGSFLLGLLGVLASERLVVSPEALTALGVGFLGSYTTFSTWQYETFRMLENASWPAGLVNLVGLPILGLGGGVVLGVVLGRTL